MAEDVKRAESKRALKKSRREFVRTLGGGVLAAAAAGVPAVSQAAQSEWAATYDWICVGSGMAGCAAAIAGTDRGMKTLLIEQMDKLGGLTAEADAALWIPMSHFMKEKGIADSREDAMKYLEFVGGGYSLPEYRAAFVDNVARVLEYLHHKAEVAFRWTDREEFFAPVAPGARKGRLHGIEPFHSESLGAWREKLRLPLHLRGFVEALGKTESPETVGGSGPARNMETQMAAWKKRLGAAKFDQLVKEDEAVREGGPAILGYLLRALLKREVEIRTETSAERLLVENGRVVGVAVKHQGREERLRANRGVLMALGGAAIRPLGDAFAWMLATTAGGETHSEPLLVPRISLPVPGEKLMDGSPFGRSEVDRPHSLVVNRFGERFGNESFFQDIGAAVNRFENWTTHRFRNVPNYLIYDHNLLEKYAWGGMPPGESENLEWVSKGQTLRELAGKLKIDGRALEAAVARFNELAKKGKDSDFNRPPKTMGPVAKPPFFGVELDTPDPFDAGTSIVTNTHGQVLHYRTKEPIPGLYSAGAITANRRIWGMGYQAGFVLMGGATFGFLAAEHAAATAG